MSGNRIELAELKKPLLIQEDRKKAIVIASRPTPTSSKAPSSKLQSRISTDLLKNSLKFLSLADLIALRQTSHYFHSNVQPFIWYSDVLVKKLKQLENQVSKYPEIAAKLDLVISYFEATLSIVNLRSQIGSFITDLPEPSDTAPGSEITKRLKPLHAMKTNQMKTISFSSVLKNKPERLLQECQNTHTILNRLETIRSQFISTIFVMNPAQQCVMSTVSTCACGTVGCLGGCCVACCFPATITVGPPYIGLGLGCFTGLVGHILGDGNRIFNPATTQRKPLERCGYAFDFCLLGIHPLNELLNEEYKDISGCRELLNDLSRDKISYQALLQLRKLNNKFKEEKIIIQENRDKDKRL